MPIYIYSKWRNSPIGSPSEFYSELDAQRYEIRKVEIFKNGKIGYASKSGTACGTRLGIIPVPSTAEIKAQSEFDIKPISKDKFEEKWREATDKQ